MASIVTAAGSTMMEAGTRITAMVSGIRTVPAGGMRMMDGIL